MMTMTTMTRLGRVETKPPKTMIRMMMGGRQEYRERASERQISICCAGRCRCIMYACVALGWSAGGRTLPFRRARESRAASAESDFSSRAGAASGRLAGQKFAAKPRRLSSAALRSPLGAEARLERRRRVAREVNFLLLDDNIFATHTRSPGQVAGRRLAGF